MRPRLMLLIVLISISLIAIAACSTSPEDTPAPDGTISGTLTIGPLCPVEPCTNPANPFAGLAVQAKQDREVVREMPVSNDGMFAGAFRPGDYELDIEDCQWLGCSQALPKSITVRSSEATVVVIDIDTGIR